MYNFSIPSRRFSTQFWAPVDLTTSPYYELFFPYTLYSTFMVGVLSLELFTALPIVGLHVKAQLDILSDYLKLLGKFFFFQVLKSKYSRKSNLGILICIVKSDISG